MTARVKAFFKAAAASLAAGAVLSVTLLSGGMSRDEAVQAVTSFKNYGQAVAECKKDLEDSECLEILDAANPCWKRADGTYCRYGYLPTPDVDGNPVACIPALTDTWFPCTVIAGEEPETVRTQPGRLPTFVQPEEE